MGSEVILLLVYGIVGLTLIFFKTKEMASFKVAKYLLVPIPDIFEWVEEAIDGTPLQDSANQYARSLEIEPRVNKTV